PIRQVERYGVKGLITQDPPGERCPHHPPDQLSDNGVVDGAPEAHHDLGTRTVPSCIEGHLEEDDAYVGVILNLAGLDLSKRSPCGNVDRTLVVKAVSDLLVAELSQRALDLRD